MKQTTEELEWTTLEIPKRKSTCLLRKWANLGNHGNIRPHPLASLIRSLSLVAPPHFGGGGGGDGDVCCKE